ncbi:MAG TPA: FKBP-type peptidyl-prolyl cis-trans isomerase [Cytophagaceae bacterium]|jgi:FKBP-type peptidyl-prolyl cis-trans isomerase|nr:FKBP-type peptidyl-prolyl cis-trans isomerase [Cytophagaceae bacterium]
MTLKKSILFTAAAALTFLLQSCGEYKKTDSGLEYKIIVDSAGPTIELGGAAFVNVRYVNEKDTFESMKAMGQPMAIPLPDSSTTKALLEEALTMLSKGDSASFKFNNDSLYKYVFHAPLPKELKPGSTTTFYFRVVNVWSKDSVKKFRDKQREEMLAMEIKRKVQIQMDSLAIADYCKKNHLKTQRTMDGVYYVVKKSVEGVTLQPGDTAQTIYTGKLLDGTTFDSNVGKEPFPVMVGMGQVIRGWDSGLMALKKGEKATLIIPSALGYGERGAGASIPPNAILVFDVEVLKQ